MNFAGQAFARVIEIDRLEGRLKQRGAESALIWGEHRRTAALSPAEFQDWTAAIAGNGPDDAHLAVRA
jgi:hypothetical protein